MLRTKTRYFFALCLLVCLFASMVSVSAETTLTRTNGVWTEKKTIKVDGTGKTFTIFWSDLNNPRIRIEAVPANNTIGSIQSLGDIVKSVKDGDGFGYAGISGSSFGKFTDLQPEGTLIVNGTPEHIYNKGTIFTIDSNNKADVIQSELLISGSYNEVDNFWTTAIINHYYESTDELMIFTPDYAGPKPTHKYTTITVDKGIVTTKDMGTFKIPSEGYIILTSNPITTNRFEIGKKIDYTFNYSLEDFNDKTVNTVTKHFDNVRSAIGAGPLLVKDGSIRVNASSPEFTGIDVNLPSTRSMIGVTANGYLGMVTVKTVSITQMATIAKALGMVDAMCLDAGDTAGVYYNGQYTVEPTRRISNAFVVKYLYNDPIQVKLNGQPLFFDADPYLNPTYNRTLVPLRKIAEALDAVVGWDSVTSSVTISRYNTNIRLQMNSTKVYVNGVYKQMELPLTVRESRSYVPVRFITEYFGGEVSWDSGTRSVLLSISSTEGLLKAGDAYAQKGMHNEAIEKYLEILEINPNDTSIIKKIALIYSDKLKDLVNGITWNKKLIAFIPSDKDALEALASQNATLGKYDDSIYWYFEYAKYYPNEPLGYYGLGMGYSSFQKHDEVNAVKYFQMALDRGLYGSQKDYAEKYILDNK